MSRRNRETFNQDKIRVRLYSIAYTLLCLSVVLGQFFDDDLRREGYEIPESESHLLHHKINRLTRRKVCRYNPGNAPSFVTSASESKPTKTSQETLKTTKTTHKSTITPQETHKTTKTTKTTTRTTTSIKTHKPSKTANQSNNPSETASSECPVQGGPCQGNELRCNGYSYAQCNLGRWTLRTCSKDKSMICVETGTSLFCAPAANYILKGCSGVPK